MYVCAVSVGRECISEKDLSYLLVVVRPKPWTKIIGVRGMSGDIKYPQAIHHRRFGAGVERSARITMTMIMCLFVVIPCMMARAIARHKKTEPLRTGKESNDIAIVMKKQ